MNDNAPSLPHILPAGTQIVTHHEISTGGGVSFPPGAVGVIVRPPVDMQHTYRVKFMDGTEVSLKRQEFSVHSHFQNPTSPADYLATVDLHRYVIYRCVVGSRAYGLDQDGSDTDLRGIYLPPAALHWSLYGLPEQLEDDVAQTCYWEMQKFIVLALKANPNVLECLYTPLVEQVSPLAQELLDMRAIFLSRLIYQTYNGYVASQFKKLHHHIEVHGTIKWKHAMHLIRLLLSGITALHEGFVPLRVEEHREKLLSIRRGEIVWEEVDAWRLTLHREFDDAFRTSKLPERPDYERANEFLIKARRSAL